MGIIRKKLFWGTSLVLTLAVGISATLIWKNGKGDASAASATNQTMMQAFEWTLNSSGTHWNDLSNQADELSEAGITSVWLPPAYKAGSVTNTGYSVYDIYDLGEFNQKGSTRTKYGTKDQYLSCIDTFHNNNISVYADVVLNHKSSADTTETVSAIEVNGSNRTEDIAEARDIEAWTVFSFPGRNGKYSSFTWDASCFDGVDWDQGSSKSAVFRFADKTWDSGVSTENGNYDYLMSADLDLESSKVIEELNTWAKWYVETANLDGFRLDAVKHMSSTFYKNWLKNIRKSSGKNLYSVAEYYDYDVSDITSYIKNTGNSTNAFDFPLHRNMVLASHDGYDLSKIFDGTLVKAYPSKTVTFVDNHDTQPGQSSDNYVEDWFKGQAYTTILTRNSGTPCVFYGDYYGTTDGKIKAISDELNVLLAARYYCAYGKQRDYLDDADVVGWTREGDKYHSYYGLAALISDGSAGTKKMYVGSKHKNETWIDITGNVDATVTIDKYGYGVFSVNEKSYSVWTSESASQAVADKVNAINGKTEVVLPEDNTITIYYNTTWTNGYIHYQLGTGDWTEAPGKIMSNTNLNDYKTIKIDLGDCKYITACFNNGDSDWDSNSGNNYCLAAGTYVISCGTVIDGAPDGYDPDAEPYVPDESDTTDDINNQVTVYYYTEWETPYMHYGIGTGGWTSVPGKAMTAVDGTMYYTLTVDMGSNTYLNACFNNGDSEWDNNNSSNYNLKTGSYIINDGTVTEGTIDDL